MNYEDHVFGMDFVIAVTSLDEPYLLSREVLNQEINKEHIEKMTVLEEEANYFMANFYNQPLSKNYSNLSKTCLVKNIYSEDEVVRTNS